MTVRTLRTTLRTTLAFAVAGLLLLAPQAWGQSTKAPPGNAGVQEYVESVPDGKGNRVANNLYHGRNNALENPGGVLGQQTQGALAGAGEDGRKAAALAQAGAPDKVRGSDGGSGSSPLSAAVERLGGGQGGMGVLLALLLVLLLVAAAAYELRRRRFAA